MHVLTALFPGSGQTDRAVVEPVLRQRQYWGSDDEGIIPFHRRIELGALQPHMPELRFFLEGRTIPFGT